MPVASTLQLSSSIGQHVETCSITLELGVAGVRASFVWNGEAELLPFDSSQHSRSRTDGNMHSAVRRARVAIANEMLECIIGSDDGTDYGCIKAVMDVMYICALRNLPGAVSDEIKLRERFPVLDKFFRLHDKLPTEESVIVVRHIQNSLLEHLKQLGEATRQKANSTRCKIKQIAAGFPSGWTSWRQKYFAACLQIVWDLPSENVLLLHESEAIANNILCGAQKSEKEAPKSRKFLIVSLDGYSLSVSTIYAECRNRNPGDFYLLSRQNDGYIHSGSHLHASMVRAKVRRYVQDHRRDILDSERNEISAQFFASYQEVWCAAVCAHAFTIRAASSSAVPHTICFNEREARKMYKDCFSHIIPALERCVEDDEEEENERAEQTEVVLAGSGFTNARLRGEVERWVTSHNMLLHDSVQSRLETYKSGSIATGAAFAILNPITVEERMRTACFAIRNSSDNEKSGLIIWRNNSSVSCRIQFLPLEAEEMSVMCSPCPERGSVTGIDINSSYEIFKLRRPKPGDYDVRMEYEKSVSGKADEITIVFGDIHCPTQEDSELQVTQSVHKFQIYVDCGSKLCFLEIDRADGSIRRLTRNVHPEEPEHLRSMTHKDLETQLRVPLGH